MSKLSGKSIRWALVPAAVLALVAPMMAAPAASAALPKLATSKVIRVGYFANVTHAAALVATSERLFQRYLPGVTIQPFIFNAGPAAIEAFKGNALDISFIGPNPAISGFATTNGDLVRIVSGSTSGGAQFVVKSNITEATLKGKNFATPGLGGTQDIALRNYLGDKGLTFKPGGDVSITPTENSTTLTLFKQGKIDGAWVPEPWASRLVLEGNGKVLVDEKSKWPKGQFVTTHIIASTKFLKQYPGSVRGIIQANIAAIDLINKNKALATDIVQGQLFKLTGKTLTDEVLNRAWGNLEFTYQPLAATLKTNAEQATQAGLLKLDRVNGSLKGIYDLTLLNQVLKDLKKPTVTAAGLGKQ